MTSSTRKFNNPFSLKQTCDLQSHKAIQLSLNR